MDKGEAYGTIASIQSQKGESPAWLLSGHWKTNIITKTMADFNQSNPALTLDPNSFTSLGPQPLRMTGCSGCFNYQLTEGRVNDIAIDPVRPMSPTRLAMAAACGRPQTAATVLRPGAL